MKIEPTKNTLKTSKHMLNLNGMVHYLVIKYKPLISKGVLNVIFYMQTLKLNHLN